MEGRGLPERPAISRMRPRYACTFAASSWAAKYFSGSAYRRTASSGNGNGSGNTREHRSHCTIRVSTPRP
jgi:hypothetical protein